MYSLITGASGFVGRNFCTLFDDNNIIKCDKKDNLHPNDIDSIIRKVSCIYHLGAISSTTETDTESIVSNNILFSCKLIERCIELEIPLIYASSASVYGLGSFGFSEGSQATPLNYYAISKSTVDKIVEQKIIDNPSAKIIGLRYFNVYGPGEQEKNNMASPVHKFLQQAKSSGVVKVFKGSENFKRDFIHVQDVAQITKQSINFPSGIYNVGTGIASSFLDVANKVSNLTGCKVQEVEFPRHLQGKYQKYTCSDNTKINNFYNDSRISLELGIEKVYHNE